MPRVHTIKARKDIYAEGVRIPDPTTKSGFRRDRSQPADSDDEVIVKAGQTYYKWEFRFGGEHISTTYPKRSQLTQSSFLSQAYDLEDRIGEITGDSPEDLQSERDDIVGELESLRDETQGSLDNMPEGLQQGDTGQLLQERIDALEGAISEFESVDLDYDEPDEDELRKELRLELEPETPAEELDATVEESLEERKQNLLQEWLDEKIGELQSISIDAS